MVGQASQIVHESETQRQFVRLQMPAQISFNNVRYSIKDLSSGGLGIFNLDPAPKKGEKLEFELILPFMDFALDITLKAEVIHADKKNKITGCRFVDVNQNQVSILNHVIKAFMAGDIVSGEEILNVVSRENFVNVRKHKQDEKESIAQKVKLYGIYGALALATVFLGFFIFNNILDRMFVVKSANGHVSAQIVQILAPSSGTFSSALPSGKASVTKGELIGVINNTTTSTAVNVISPCDCFIKEKSVIESTYIIESSNLYSLVPQRAKITIESMVPMGDASRLRIGTSAVIRIAGSGMEIEGEVTNVMRSNEATAIGALPQSVVTIEPKEAITLDQVDRPAFVEFYL